MKEIVIPKEIDEMLAAAAATYRPPRIWTDAQEAMVRKWYRLVPSTAMVKATGHSWEAIKQKASALGVSVGTG